MGILYLFPNVLSDVSPEAVIPSDVLKKIVSVRAFASENPKNTRRFLKRIDRELDVSSIRFVELSEHSDFSAVEECMKILQEEDMGIISEAGCPGIADPGADLVAAAHAKGVRVVPYVGPSSILLALIASGANGQSFSFNGYLPIKEPERGKKIREYELISMHEKRTQIFIETPYRNMRLFSELLERLKPSTVLTVACNLTGEDEYVRSLPVMEWKRTGLPDLHKKPTIFLFIAR